MKRIKDAEEIQEQLEHGRLKRTGTRNKYGNCVDMGHNMKGCKRTKNDGVHPAARTADPTISVPNTQQSIAPMQLDQAQNLGLSRKEAHDMAKRTSATKQVQLRGSSQALFAISGAQIMPYAHSSKGQHRTTLGYITDAAHKRSKELQ